MRDYIKLKMPVTHPSGEMRFTFRKTNVEFRKGIWTGERNWGPISTISSCVIWIFYEENVFRSFRKAGVWQHVRS